MSQLALAQMGLPAGEWIEALRTYPPARKFLARPVTIELPVAALDELEAYASVLFRGREWPRAARLDEWRDERWGDMVRAELRLDVAAAYAAYLYSQPVERKSAEHFARVACVYGVLLALPARLILEVRQHARDIRRGQAMRN